MKYLSIKVKSHVWKQTGKSLYNFTNMDALGIPIRKNMSENVGSHDLHIKQSDNFSLFDTSWLFASTDLFYIIPIMTSPHSKKHNQSQSPICESYTGREILPTQPMHFFQGNSCKIIIQFASSLVITKWVPFFMIPELWRRQSSLWNSHATLFLPWENP